MIHQKLASSRKELLDIGLRNNLLNFRPNARSLRIVGEQSKDILQLLYANGTSMTFAATARSSKSQSDLLADDSAASEQLLHELEDANWAPSSSQEIDASRFTDSVLQTSLGDEKLFLQLLKINTDAENILQEQGVNLLFLALGFLEWYEADSSDKPRRAPLLLLPVQLSRSGTRDAFKLSYSEDDLVQNLSLAAKLKAEFGVTLPEFVVNEEAQESVTSALECFQNELADTIGRFNRWSVKRDEIFLGFFSFAKFLMFKDLDPEGWPEDQQPENHPVLSRLLGSGFRHEYAAFDEGANIDEVIAPGEVHFVKDADSSQTLAILEAREKRNLVIQGPPGTGKSQTITNILAESLAQGRKVLFVAEKMAALDVVKRRLDECQLGDAVLELHSHKATKTSVIAELGRTLRQGRPIVDVAQDQWKLLQSRRDTLNAHSAAVNGQITNTEVTFIEALGHYLRLQRELSHQSPRAILQLRDINQKAYLQHRQVVTELADLMAVLGQLTAHSCWGTSKPQFSPLDQQQVFALLGQIEPSLVVLKLQAEVLQIDLGVVGRNTTLQELEHLANLVIAQADAPDTSLLDTMRTEWGTKRTDLEALLIAGQTVSDIRKEHQSILIDQAWEQDVLDDRQTLLTYGRKWWRIFSGKYRNTKARMRALIRMSLPGNNQIWLTWLNDILRVQAAAKIYNEQKALGEQLFGGAWQGVCSPWPLLIQQASWLSTLHEKVAAGTIPVEILSRLMTGDRQGELSNAKAFKQSWLQLKPQLLTAVELIGLSDSNLEALNPIGLGNRVSQWRLQLATMPAVIRSQGCIATLKSSGFGELAQDAITWSRSAQDFVREYDFAWYAALLKRAYLQNPSLAAFDRLSHEQQLTDFRSLDKNALNLSQQKLAEVIWRQMPRTDLPGEMDVLDRELNKKRRHLPIRQLMSKAGRAIQQIKPIFMMSPMSIANFLPPGELEFDLVVFDEASQVKAVDAFGAILRGKQVVVVGDTKQMPPTDFFGTDLEVDDEDNVTSDIESVLAMFRAKGAQERYLSWHYRSRHESLIAVSNVEFYERRLIVFPTSGMQSTATGLRMHLNAGALYDRGRTRTNREEAKAVANFLLEHAKDREQLSIGIVAFSVAQRDLIQVEVELLRRKHPVLDRFCSRANPAEPFFIKNLENVQGDERDVIVISIGYGRNESGRIAKEFGPLNRVGGERRLNVLITRAKLAMEVFCNFKAEDLDLDANASHGVRALKHFLKYAETAELDIPKETGKEADSPFEVEVMNVLKERGYQVEPQVGTAGYFIDIGVRDPDAPGRYIMAVECDGASYHSSKSARDRDRLRQGVLESLGWRFHRIWSTDWFRSPEYETQRMVDAIEAARASRPLINASSSNGNETPAVLERGDGGDIVESKSLVDAYEVVRLPSRFGLQLHDVAVKTLAEQVLQVVAIEAPVHADTVIRRLMAAYGVARAGNRIVANVEQAIRFGSASDMFHAQNDFIYCDKTKPAKLRNRAMLEVADRKLELVAPEDIDLALCHVVKLGFSMQKDIAISEALSALGFGRATQKATQLLSERIDVLIANAALRLSGEVLSVM